MKKYIATYGQGMNNREATVEACGHAQAYQAAKLLVRSGEVLRGVREA